MPLTEENSKKISEVINSYLKATFFALFYNKKIIFHDNPHSGNIYIDNDENIGFLDRGLIFELPEENLKLIKEFFFSAYTGNYEKMYTVLIPYGKMNDEKKVYLKKI